MTKFQVRFSAVWCAELFGGAVGILLMVFLDKMLLFFAVLI